MIAFNWINWVTKFHAAHFNPMALFQAFRCLIEEKFVRQGLYSMSLCSASEIKLWFARSSRICFQIAFSRHLHKTQVGLASLQFSGLFLVSPLYIPTTTAVFHSSRTFSYLRETFNSCMREAVRNSASSRTVAQCDPLGPVSLSLFGARNYVTILSPLQRVPTLPRSGSSRDSQFDVNFIWKPENPVNVFIKHMPFWIWPTQDSHPVVLVRRHGLWSFFTLQPSGPWGLFWNFVIGYAQTISLTFSGSIVLYCELFCNFCMSSG